MTDEARDVNVNEGEQERGRSDQAGRENAPGQNKEPGSPATGKGQAREERPDTDGDDTATAAV